ncbi:MAG: UDP-N-acetylmuramoylalanine--D-glutamate ligase [Actinomycetota bacterium]
MKYLVAGLGRTGASVVRMARSDGADVFGYDDNDDVARRVGAELDVDAVGSSPQFVETALAQVDEVVVSPGFPIAHPVRVAAATRGVRVIGDVELASSRTSTPIIAVTGTNGKSTVTRLIADMLNAADMKAVEAGNVGYPMLDAINDPAEFYVVEVSSFQLADTHDFHPLVAVWTNLSPDHLDWHPDLAHYVASKARIWANQTEADLAVVNADDAVVLDAAKGAAARRVTFGIDTGDAHVRDGCLVGPQGDDLGAVADMSRPFPHELTNGLAAACAALGVGASPEACRDALRDFRGLPHRIQLVGHIGGVPCFDDSKATTPASVVTALRGFPSAVLIAGGKNKGLDLSVLAEAIDHVRAVVTIGTAAPEVAAVFEGRRPVTHAASMDAAVAQAANAAQDGDAVLLSPACTSWDAYRNYAERGDDFARAVNELAARR